jgi:hypothetical protein
MVTALCVGLGSSFAALADDAAIIISRNSTADAAVADLDVRPNTRQPFFILVKNISAVRRTFFVEIEGLKGTPLQAREEIQLAVNEVQAVAFKPPPPPKKDEPPKAPVEPKKEAAEPPPGVPLKLVDLGRGRLGFGFKVRVLNDDGKPAAPDRTVSVTVLHPSTYVDEPVVTLEGSNGKRGISAAVRAKSRKPTPDDKTPEVDLQPPAEVVLAFPPQLAIKATDLRAGTYRRNLSRTGQTVDLTATNLPLTSSNAPVKFNLTVDGYPRSFAYSVNARREVSAIRTNNRIDRDRLPAVRLLPTDGSARARALIHRVISGATETQRFATTPTKDLRFRVETDNEPAGSTLLLRVDRSGKSEFADPDEVVNLGLPKDQRFWLDLAGPEGALLLTNTVVDHVAGVDVSALRGPHELQAALLSPDPLNPTRPIETKFVYNLIVDATPPPVDDIKFGTFPKRLERGKPLPVLVAAADPETEIVRVTVVLGKPGPEGKFPPEAASVDAERTPLGWVAQLPLSLPPPAPTPPPSAPAPKKEPIPPFDVTAIVENEAGLTTPKVIRIELVEPKGATIEARIERGGRPQPGAAVSLRDADGKEKGAATTDAKGMARFENVQPGVYRISAAKEDAGLGLSGTLSTQVPDPPPTKPIQVVLPLAKRR